MKKIVYELNEVPKRLFDFYADAFPKSAFAKLRGRSELFETRTADVGHLSPWITWPSLHRGVSNLQHEISDLGQDLTEVNKEFPSVFSILADQDVKVGVFGSLQSYPMPENLDNYSFYVPDTFAAGSECFPKQLSDFQAFNLSMVKSSGRNVGGGVAVRELAKFLKNARQLGLTLSTVGKLVHQLASERVTPDRKVRRRSSQVEIAFDLYYKQLKETLPDVSFFFTNHVASSMHRYWPTVFPKDYEENKFESEWLERWKKEIPHAVRIANHQLGLLIELCDAKAMELIVCSSMGQGAVQDASPISKQVLITNIKKLLEYIGMTEADWEARLAMAPRVVVKPVSDRFVPALEKLNHLKINGHPLECVVTSTGDVRFKVEIFDIDELDIRDNGVQLDPNSLGIEIIDLQDATGSYAYHIPEGILLHYKPARHNAPDGAKRWRSVSALDVCPSLISSFGGSVPGYMTGESGLFA
ncbi:MAG: hypothetical protein AAFX06_33645 [Planctomycetota bacterium]